MTKPAAGTGGRVSLVAFVKQERQSKCPGCAIPEDVRQEIIEARTKKIGNDQVVRWLKSMGFQITPDELKSHQSGNHDAQLRALMTEEV